MTDDSRECFETMDRHLAGLIQSLADEIADERTLSRGMVTLRPKLARQIKSALVQYRTHLQVAQRAQAREK